MNIRQPTPSRGFTLIELLVVISIIALLIGILLSVLASARGSARNAQCKALLHQYGLANAMYVNDYRDGCPDVYKIYDYRKGLVQYMSQAEQMGEKIARCADDGSTQSRGRLGSMGNSADPAYKIHDRQGNEYTVQVSIGANENSSSASLQVGPGGTSQRWIKQTELLKMGSSSKTMTFADYQYNRGQASSIIPDEMAPTVGPGWLPPNAGENDKMGSLAFRHKNTFNAAYIDGHTGSIRCEQQLTEDGHELAAGEDWGAPPASLGLPAFVRYGSYAAHKIFYPFGPATSGALPGVYGTMGGWYLN